MKSSVSIWIIFNGLIIIFIILYYFNHASSQPSSSQTSQSSIMNEYLTVDYLELHAKDGNTLLIKEAKIFSQNGEDGVLFNLFDGIGTTNKEYVEFGVQNGIERSTRALEEVRGWTGLLMDGSYEDPKINLHKQFIQGEDIRSVLHKHGVKRDVDLLVIDIDSNDYWVWWALCATGNELDSEISPESLPFRLETHLEHFTPRVISVEYNARWAPPDDRFVMYIKGRWRVGSEYFGGSIEAFVRLGKVLGYSLVYCESQGVNLFFVRNDIARRYSLKSTRELYRPPRYNRGKGWVGAVPAGYHWIFYTRKNKASHTNKNGTNFLT